MTTKAVERNEKCHSKGRQMSETTKPLLSLRRSLCFSLPLFPFCLFLFYSFSFSSFRSSFSSSLSLFFEFPFPLFLLSLSLSFLFSFSLPHSCLIWPVSHKQPLRIARLNV